MNYKVEIPAKPHIPESQSIVHVAIIDNTTRMGNVPASHYQGPSGAYPSLTIPGDPIPSYSFYIVHQRSGTKLLFDLGLRVDWKTKSSPAIIRWIREAKVYVNVDRDIATILREGGVNPLEIDTVIFSHQHFDHTGDTHGFAKDMKIIVGPGYRKAYLPGWPEQKCSWETTSDLYHDRNVVEISFSSLRDSSRVLRIGNIEAYDYFGDGSFYLLNTPGHTIGHLSALARTSAADPANESTFILLGGDVAHSFALLRPSPMLPLPTSIRLRSASQDSAFPLQTKSIASTHYAYKDADEGYEARRKPFCCATGPHHDVHAAQTTIDGISELDSMDNIFTVIAHDHTLQDTIALFPKFANNWKRAGWREKCLWKFLGGFQPRSDSTTKPASVPKL